MEADITESDLIHSFADFLRKVLTEVAPQSHCTHQLRPNLEIVFIVKTLKRSLIAQQPDLPSVGVASTSYELKKFWHNNGSEDDETSGLDDARAVYEGSSPYLSNMRFLYEQYDIRRDGNALMIGSAGVLQM